MRAVRDVEQGAVEAAAWRRRLEQELTEARVRERREVNTLLRRKRSQSHVADLLGVTRQYIQQIAAGRR